MPRELALKILHDIFENDAYADLAVKEALSKTKLNVRDKALATNIVYGTIQNLRFIDYQIAAFSKRQIKSLTPSIRDILRMTVYQLRFLDRVPDRAAVNEAVQLAKRYAFSASSFVNGVLRNMLRESWKYPTDRKKRLGVAYSFPDWLVELWLKQYGEEECEALMQASNQTPPLSVRVNRTKVEPEEVLCLCKGRETAIEGGLHIDEPSNIADTDMFKDGWLTVQDIGAQMASITLAPLPGQRVLDVCAAPGGKTTHMAELMQNQGEVTAWDIHSHKVELIRKNAERLGLDIVQASCHDARELDKKLVGCYDKVMVDVPCSGLGILRKKPDIKWRRIPENLPALCREQAQILETASAYVRPGGELLYCTCTLNDAENRQIIAAFLKEHTAFRRIEKDRTLMPHTDNTDGFFIAKLRKRKT